MRFVGVGNRRRLKHTCVAALGVATCGVVGTWARIKGGLVWNGVLFCVSTLSFLFFVACSKYIARGLSVLSMHTAPSLRETQPHAKPDHLKQRRTTRRQTRKPRPR
eukprot:TRINITY_DN1995_c0_g1_i5.p5 TRINITY_DN1995_c0_g1~~TRINITY_DN1995_c0_g1_i5.p5  ORF type:complete len:106 (-),score=0.90 TRINITY_DN1995_c0_g1_i5:682-999(-)